MNLFQSQSSEVKVSSNGSSRLISSITESKLQAVAHTSALMAGFGMVALVELQLDLESKVPKVLMVMFVACTCLLVSVNMVALMISSCILPHIATTWRSHVPKQVEEGGEDERNEIVGRLQCFIEIAWFLCSVVGISLFMFDVTLICWIKFHDTEYGEIIGITATAITLPVTLALAVLAIKLHRDVISYHYRRATMIVGGLDHQLAQIRDFP